MKHAALTFFVLLAACSDAASDANEARDLAPPAPTPTTRPAPEPGLAPDAGAAPDAEAPPLTPGKPFAAGIGEPTIFIPVVAGDVLLLQRGCQGAQHIFTSLRMLDPGQDVGRVAVSVHRESDGLLVSVPLDVRLPLEADPFSDRVRRVTGLTPVIEVPSDVVDQAVEVRATFTTDAGAVHSASFRGVVRWGTDSCGAH
ncbi:MAG: hypothetical protein EOP08_13120 [Proteobacteria bacterium]|nr:MAG: hypothetical protein EOP08_13120 [Pseudomonadota bacterium]